MGLYTKLNDVRIRLIGKVSFTEDDQDENKMHTSLANRLINEAEGQVEMDLSPRYMAPFQTIEGGAFSALPVRPTQELLRTLAEMMSCIRILNTDFGSGTPADASKYAKSLQDTYDKLTERMLKKEEDTFRNWLYPPLEGLRLNWHNEKADDGYAGSAQHVTRGEGGFAAEQMNQPSATPWNVSWEDCNAK